MRKRKAACGMSGLPIEKVVTRADDVIAQLVVVSRRWRYVTIRPTSARYRWIIACSAPGDSGSRVLLGGGSVGSTTPRTGGDRSTSMLLCNLALSCRLALSSGAHA